MRNVQVLMLLIVFLTLFNCKNEDKYNDKTSIPTLGLENIDEIHVEKAENNFGIVIHGGAGTILKKNMTDSLELAYQQKMEDSPLFNAGKGAVFTHEKRNELDASVMDGETLNAGAVSGVTRIKNPIDLALTVMTQSQHVMLSGTGAEEFAALKGFELVDPSYFYTENRMQSLLRTQEREKQTDSDGTASVFAKDPYMKDSKFGTVGCAALDKNGNLAAGTSTGGMTNKRWNRIGDAPIIGAGTYANNATCAVSSTGWGEYFIRAMVAHDISAMMEYKGVSLEEAAREVIQEKVPALGGDGGIVAIDKDGNVTMEFNTAGMYRAHMNAKGELIVGIYAKE